MARRKKSIPSVKKAIKPTDAVTPPLGRRPVWSGNLRLSLVSCPIAIYAAVSHEREVAFHLINPATNNRIRMVPTDPDTGPVQRSDLVRGYEFEKDRYAIVTQEELDAVRLDTTNTLDIERFVDAAAIDRLFWSEPYYLIPENETATESYSVVREALRGTKRIALGRIVMHTRERLMAVEPREDGLLAFTLRTHDDVIAPSKAFDDIPKVKVDRQMIEIAEKIIAQSEGPFDTSQFKDRYEDALRELVKKKQRGETIESPQPEHSNVINLMDALRRSLVKSQPAATKSTTPKRRRK